MGTSDNVFTCVQWGEKNTIDGKNTLKYKLFLLKRYFYFKFILFLNFVAKIPSHEMIRSETTFVQFWMSLTFSLPFPPTSPLHPKCICMLSFRLWNTGKIQYSVNIWEPLVFSVSFSKILYFWLIGRKYIFWHNITRKYF